MRSNKHLQKVALAFFALFLSLTSSAQICPGTILSDDFSNPALWTIMNPPSASGNLGITGGVTKYYNFQGRQLYRLVRDMGAPLPNSNFWRMEFESIITEDAILSGAMLMALTSNDLHPRTIGPGNFTETNNNTIEILLGNPLNSTTPDGDLISLQSKVGTTRGVSCNPIPIDRNVLYYFRVERLSAVEVVLSVFDDPARTNHVPGSPLCCEIDPGIGDLRYLQQGVWTTSSQNRYMTGYTDNLCIYSSVVSKNCLEVECDLNPDLHFTYNSDCSVTITNTSSAGSGSTLFPMSRIDFSDGTWAWLAPGASMTKSFPGFGGHWAQLLVKGYNANYDCCEKEAFFPIEFDCEVPGKPFEERMGQFGFQGELEVFPNPSEGIVQLRSAKEVQSVKVFDATGRLVREFSKEGTELQFDLSSLGNGIFYLEMKVKGENETVKRKVSLL